MFFTDNQSDDSFLHDFNQINNPTFYSLLDDDDDDEWDDDDDDDD